MLRRGFLFTVFLLLIIIGKAQSVDQDYNDGRLWFKINSINDLNEQQWMMVTQNENNIPFSVFDFIDDLKDQFSIKQLSRPYSRAVGSENLLNTFLL